MIARILVSCWLILLFPFLTLASYTVEGNLNMKGEWQDKICLATIDKLDDYYSAKDVPCFYYKPVSFLEIRIKKVSNKLITFLN